MRKEITVTLDDRGNKLTFKIKEMPATKLESWVVRALLLLSSSGIETPNGSDLNQAAEYLQTNGFNALRNLEYEKVKPLMDELLTCCEKVNDDGSIMPVRLDTMDGYIEDAFTILKLRLEVLKLNLSFFKAGDSLNLK